MRLRLLDKLFSPESAEGNGLAKLLPALGVEEIEQPEESQEVDCPVNRCHEDT